MKRHYRTFFLQKLIISDSTAPDAISRFLKSWTLLDTISTVAAAWSAVPSTALSKSWKALLGENVLSTTEDQQTNKIMAMLKIIHGSDTCSSTDIQQWAQEDSHTPAWRVFTDNELVRQFSGINNNKVSTQNLIYNKI